VHAATYKSGGNQREKNAMPPRLACRFQRHHPFRPSMNWETVVPSQCDCAKLFRIPRSTCRCVNGALITKRQQLTAGERGIYWALATTKRGYSTISNELKSIFVLPNTKDTLQVKNANGDKVLVRKILTMVGLGTIFSDIVRDHPTIKNKVGEHAFWYIVSGLGCVCRFTDSHKTMCGCTECVGLHTLHHLLQAKCGIMARQIAIDAQRRTTKVHAEEMVRGWERLCCIQSHRTPLGQAPALNGVQTMFRTGTAKLLSAKNARSTPCRMKRHMRMPVPKTSRSTSTSIKFCCGRMERSDHDLSSFRSEPR